MNFVISIKVDETIPREDFRKTLEALTKNLKDPKLEKFSIQFIKKDPKKRGKMLVEVVEFPLSKINK